MVARVVVAVVAGAVCCASAARAAVLYDNTPLSNATTGFVAGASDAMTNVVRANDFTLPGITPATVQSVTFWGGYLPLGTAAAVDNFTIAFYADNAGFPALVPFSSQAVGVTRVATGQTLFGSVTTPEYLYTANLPVGVQFAGSTKYWISIYNATGGAGGTFWAWRTTANAPSGTGDAVRDPSTLTPLVWAPGNTSYDEAFVLDSAVAVPEPATLLMLAGVPLLMGRRRRA